MKYALIAIVFFLIFKTEAQPLFSENGHPEHLITGTLISGVTSYLVYKKTNNKFKAWIIGAATSTAIGYLKEVVDPKWFNGVRSTEDFKYSAFGSVIGASIVIPLNRRKPKKIPIQQNFPISGISF